MFSLVINQYVFEPAGETPFVRQPLSNQASYINGIWTTWFQQRSRLRWTTQRIRGTKKQQFRITNFLMPGTFT